MKQIKYKSTRRIGLFDKDETLSNLSKLGNPLEKLHNIIDFEMFRLGLDVNMLDQEKKSPSGCKPFDVIMMFLMFRISYNL